MSWFKEWFDSPLYEKLYAYRNDEEAARLADLLEREIPQNQYPKILDLGCGRGRHSLSLAERGYHVTGIDLSETAIATARENASERNLDITFAVRDMREPLPEKFDAIVNLFTTFGYFRSDEENIKVVDGIASMLSPGGIFVMDYLNENLARTDLIPEESGTYDSLQYHIERKIEEDMIFKQITFSGDELKGDLQYQERVKLYDPSWFEKVFDGCGLKMKKYYGTYSGGPFDKESSPRLIMIAEKTG